jgi:hypothetical protein
MLDICRDTLGDSKGMLTLLLLGRKGAGDTGRLRGALLEAHQGSACEQASLPQELGNMRMCVLVYIMCMYVCMCVCVYVCMYVL